MVNKGKKKKSYKVTRVCQKNADIQIKHGPTWARQSMSMQWR